MTATAYEAPTFMVLSLCAWCYRVAEEKVPSCIDQPSHGICDPCAVRVKATAKAAREALRRAR
jgi:hypothetical protein